MAISGPTCIQRDGDQRTGLHPAGWRSADRLPCIQRDGDQRTDLHPAGWRSADRLICTSQGKLELKGGGLRIWPLYIFVIRAAGELSEPT
jgi:hypothetical protein